MRKVSLLVATSIAAAALTAAAPAAATPLLFTITGDYSATFTLDSNPVPSYVGVYDSGFNLPPGSFENSPNNHVSVQFDDAAYQGGLVIYDFHLAQFILNATGPQIYSGTLTNPVFAPGTFALADFNPTGDTYTLTITNAAVPEPASWAMMLLGFGGIALAMRRRPARRSGKPDALLR